MATIFIDYVSPTNVARTIRTDRVIPTNTAYRIPQLVINPFSSEFSSEFGAGSIAGWNVAPMMVTSTSLSDIDVPLARSSNFVRDEVDVLNYTSSEYRDVVIPVQEKTASSYDIVSPVNWGASSYSTPRVRTNFSAIIYRDDKPAVTWTGIASLFVDFNSPIGWSATEQSDIKPPLYTSGNIAPDIVIPDQWLGINYISFRPPVSSGLVVSPDDPVSIYWPTIFQSPRPFIPVGYGLSVTQDEPLPEAFGATGIVPNAVPSAYTATSAKDVVSPTSMSSVTVSDRTYPMIISSSGINPISGDIVSPLGWSVAISEDYTAAVAVNLDMGLDAVSPIATGASALPDNAIPVMNAASVVADRTANVQTSAQFIADVGIVVGYSVGFVMDYKIPVYWLLSVALEELDYPSPMSWGSGISLTYREPLIIPPLTWFERSILERTVAPENTYITWIDGREIRKVEF